MKKFLDQKIGLALAAKNLTVGSAALVFISAAIAYSAGGMPWEGPLALIQQSLSGIVAGVIAMIALFVAGAALIFGEDLGGFAKKLIGFVMAASILVLGNVFLSALGLVGSGMVIGL